MSRILLLLLLLFPLSSLSQEPANQEQTSEATSNGNNGGVEEISNQIRVISTELSRLDSAVDSLARNEAANNNQREYEKAALAVQLRDLENQSSMANAAWWVFWAAVVGLLFTVIGLVLLGKTLVYTRSAAESTDKTLKIAEKTNDTARVIGEAQVRCYLSIEFDIGFNEDVASMRFEIACSNYGQSPAKNVEVMFNIGSRSVPYDFFMEEGSTIGHVAAGKTETSKFEIGNAASASAFSGGLDSLNGGFGLVVIFATDVFGNEIEEILPFEFVKNKHASEGVFSTHVSFRTRGDYSQEDVERLRQFSKFRARDDMPLPGSVGSNGWKYKNQYGKPVSRF